MIAFLDPGVQAGALKNYTSVCTRNLLLLKKELGGDIIITPTQVIGAREKVYDAVVCGFGKPYTEINTSKTIIANAKKIFWLVGEYEQSTFQPLYYSGREYEAEVIANGDFENINRFSRFKSVHKVNFNLLISRKPNQAWNKKYDCIYYSRWRPDRAKYCKEYLQDGIYFSTDPRKMKYFKHIGCNPKYINKLSWHEREETLNNFRYSLYIEDEYTHKVFNNLANRWYEAGFCNNVVFFDRNCLGTIRKSEIAQFENEMEPYLVSTHAELLEKIEICNKDFNHHLETQKRWRADELRLRAEMLDELRRIINQ